MNRCQFAGMCGLVVLLSGTSLLAEVPTLLLGEKPAFGLFQPRVTVSVAGPSGQSFGPESSSFLLDTGASGVVVYPPATTEMATEGFQNEGEFEEIGIAGTDIFGVSAPYGVDFSGTDGATHTLEGVRMLSGDSPPDPTGLMSLHGIIGMPAMRGRVTTLDNRSREGALPLSMRVEFHDQLPTSNTHRFTVPLAELDFPAAGEGPLPTFESISTLTVHGYQGDARATANLVLDSGAQFTILSSQMANDLGLDTNGNGDFLDEAITTVPLSGASGQIDAPVLAIESMAIPTDQGMALTWTNAEVVIFDIHPKIEGVLGADFMSGDGGLDLSLLGAGGGGGGLTDLLGDLLGGDGGLNLEDLLGDLLGGGGGGLDLGGLLGGGGGLDLGGLLGGGGGLNVGGLLGGPAAADDGGDPLDDLLGGLLGGGLGGLLGGGSDLFSSFPLESYFDRVHFDYLDFPQRGQLVFDVNPEVSARLLNGDGRFDVADIDDLMSAMGTPSPAFDLNQDGAVDELDLGLLVEDVFQTTAGDTNLDGQVDFADFLTFSSGFGEEDATWGSGDFDGDGSSSFPDFLLLSENFGRPGQASVPETTYGSWVFLLALVGRMRLRRQGRLR